MVTMEMLKPNKIRWIYKPCSNNTVMRNVANRRLNSQAIPDCNVRPRRVRTNHSDVEMEGPSSAQNNLPPAPSLGTQKWNQLENRQQAIRQDFNNFSTTVTRFIEDSAHNQSIFNHHMHSHEFIQETHYKWNEEQRHRTWTTNALTDICSSLNCSIPPPQNPPATMDNLINNLLKNEGGYDLNAYLSDEDDAES